MPVQFPGRENRVRENLVYDLRDFFLRCNENLPRLLRDRLTVQEVLFDSGGFAVADSAYRDNPMNRYLNAALSEAVVHHVRGRAGASPVLVLELGAGRRVDA